MEIEIGQAPPRERESLIVIIKTKSEDQIFISFVPSGHIIFVICNKIKRRIHMRKDKL